MYGERPRGCHYCEEAGHDVSGGCLQRYCAKVWGGEGRREGRMEGRREGRMEEGGKEGDREREREIEREEGRDFGAVNVEEYVW